MKLEKILWNDVIYITQYATSRYTTALLYLVLSHRTLDIRRSVARKIVRNLSQRTETFTKEDSIFTIETTFLKMGMLNQMILILLTIIIMTLIEIISSTIKDISILGIAKSALFVYKSNLTCIIIFVIIKRIYLLLVEIVINF